MSMTRERAAEWFETHMPTGKIKPVQKQAYLMALAALRPVSREQAEKMRGEWVRTHSTDNFWTEVWKCSYCGFEDDNGDCFDFCPECGQPKTNEAVDMMLERLEALKDGSTTD